MDLVTVHEDYQNIGNKVKDVKQGHIYIHKNGDCLVYLGLSVKGKHVFHWVYSAKVSECDRFNIMYQEVFANNMPIQAEDVLRSKDFSNFQEYVNVPNLIGHVGEVHKFKDWYASVQEKLGDKAPLLLDSLEDVDESYKPVPRDQMVVGRAYISGKSNVGDRFTEGHRSTYIYLGGNNFLFVGGPSDLVERDALHTIRMYATRMDNYSTFGKSKSMFEFHYPEFTILNEKKFDVNKQVEEAEKIKKFRNVQKGRLTVEKY